MTDSAVSITLPGIVHSHNSINPSIVRADPEKVNLEIRIGKIASEAIDNLEKQISKLKSMRASKDRSINCRMGFCFLISSGTAFLVTLGANDILDRLNNPYARVSSLIGIIIVALSIFLYVIIFPVNDCLDRFEIPRNSISAQISSLTKLKNHVQEIKDNREQLSVSGTIKPLTADIQLYVLMTSQDANGKWTLEIEDQVERKTETKA